MVGFTSSISLPNYSFPVSGGGGGGSDTAGGGAPAMDSSLRLPSDEAFWPSSPRSTGSPPSLLWTTDPTSDGDAAADGEHHETPMGACLLRWGTKRKVRYLERSRESSEPRFLDRVHQPPPPPPPPPMDPTLPPSSEPSSSSISKAEDQQIETRNSPSSSTKRPKRDKERKVKAEGEQQEKRASGPRVDRWSAERYEAAELKLVEVMREKGGGLCNPILRQTLRDEARRHIGDTGLLDHLLKHMVGMVVTGGVERFRRQHNAAGELEYWLEPADLMEIRRKAGVTDTYWFPPPGWKLGDPTSVCSCTAECQHEMNRLKEEVAYLKRVIEQLRKQDRDTPLESDNGCDVRHTAYVEENWGMNQDTQFMKDVKFTKSGFTGSRR